MDVPEAGKHVKKSTSQKLEDQKKVIKQKNLVMPSFSLPLEIGFLYLLMFMLLLQKKTKTHLWLFLMSICIHMPALGFELLAPGK